MTRTLRLLSILLGAVAIITSSDLVHADETSTPTVTAEWRLVDVTITPETLSVGGIATISFQIQDETGTPVPGLHVNASLRAPSNSYSDNPPSPILTTIGTATEEPGWYEARLALNQAGNWWIEIDAFDEGQRRARLSRFVVVEPATETPMTTTDDPVFLQDDSWGAYYRLNPLTGNVTRITGHGIREAGERWWITDNHIEPVTEISPLYGGTWHVKLALRDGLSSQPISTIDLGEIRASVYVGSVDQPAIATAFAFAPDGSRAYVFMTRQLGEGWLSWVTTADPTTGEILQQKMLRGAIAADGAWGEINVSPDGEYLFVAEQIVRSARVSGYRLTTLASETLEPVEQHRHTEAPDAPLTSCLLTFPNPTGPVGDHQSLRYSLCAPNNRVEQTALVTWDARAGTIIHQIDLSLITADAPHFVDGVTSPDGTTFFAVNTMTHQVAEIDMLSGTISRIEHFLTDPDPAENQEPDPSTWDRFVDWFLGAVSDSAKAGVFIEPSVEIAPDGSALYVVAPGDGNESGDGIWVIDRESLQVVEHILGGETIAGMIVTAAGDLTIVHRSSSSRDAIAVVDPDGSMLVSLEIPERVTASSSR